jgi:cyanophycinase-like exopeptidase
MDATLLARAPGPVAVLALASTPGRDHDCTLERATTYYRALRAEVLVAADPLALIAEAALVVLTGGSPSRLRRCLVGTAVGAALAEHAARGGAVSGASAGAMLLGAWTVLPEEGPRFDTGLGLAGDAVVVPHWSGRREDWLAVVDRGTVLGLPEESGFLVDDDGLTALGQRPSLLVDAQTEVRVGTRIPLPWVG